MFFTRAERELREMVISRLARYCLLTQVHLDDCHCIDVSTGKDTGVENCFVAQIICQHWGLIWQRLGRFSFALLRGFFLSMMSATLLSHMGEDE